MSKHMKAQRGDATAVLVVILVVALLGALGFIVWQKFIKTDDTTSSTAPVTSQPVDNQTNDKALVLTGWNVELPLNDDLSRVTVKSVTDESDGESSLAFVIPESVLFGDEAKTGTVELGRPWRETKSEHDKNVKEGVPGYGPDFSGVTIDGYVYSYRPRQQSQYEDSTEANKQANQKLANLSSKVLPEQFKNLRKAE